MITEEQKNEVVETLLGTSMTFEEGVQLTLANKEEDWDEDDFDGIEEEIFRCEQCDTWCSTDDYSDQISICVLCCEIENEHNEDEDEDDPLETDNGKVNI